ncbi:ATP-binding protein [Duganella sp. FT3S]|uniref:ATP-binding protein n=1 Tax=Rugamonas fusca TaxID=2758568 RepID=A0A7W2EFV0_9BURK|nr:ATP-binding protein [Rugamonas fusca]MBA5605036.1 ATP-binding protein [Rugamonas fusca]
MADATLHLIEGPVGAGKSTYAMALASEHGAVHIALDEWFASIFSPDRPEQEVIPWYIERKDRLINLIWNHSKRLLNSGCNVILELGLIQQAARMDFCHRVQSDGYDPILHILDAPVHIRRERVRQRNQQKGATFSMVVPDHIFELASSQWQAPNEAECSLFNVKFVGGPSLEDRWGNVSQVAAYGQGHRSA